LVFEETMRRHKTKKGDFKYGPERMREWYTVAHKSEHELETLIPETYSINQTIKKIVETSNINIEKTAT